MALGNENDPSSANAGRGSSRCSARPSTIATTASSQTGQRSLPPVSPANTSPNSSSHVACRQARYAPGAPRSFIIASDSPLVRFRWSSATKPEAVVTGTPGVEQDLPSGDVVAHLPAVAPVRIPAEGERHDLDAPGHGRVDQEGRGDV